MKILILQLARFGDIYQTYPALNALKRVYPSAKIDVLVREKFAKAAEACESIDEIIQLNTKEILHPFLQPLTSDEDTFSDELSESLLEIGKLLDKLKLNEYTHIYNISFSPLSSYLLSTLTEESMHIGGYSRHSDGYLSIFGDISAYFYAQVGVGKKNRFHLCDIFANVVGVELEDRDFQVSQNALAGTKAELSQIDKYICFHLAASTEDKTLEPFKWVQVIRKLRDIKDISIVLLGAANEQTIADEVMQQIDDKRIINLVGNTEFSELLGVVNKAQLVVGADSLFMQLANLVQTPCLNFSFPSVNFWETGPLASQSAVVYKESREMLTSDVLSNEITLFLSSDEFSDTCIRKSDKGLTRYNVDLDEVFDFHWNLIKALYLPGQVFPHLLLQEHFQAIWQLKDILGFVIDQVEKMEGQSDDKLQDLNLSIVESEQLIGAIFRLVPDLMPIYWWFQTEKIRIAPAPLSHIINETKSKYEQLLAVVDLYISMDPGADHKQIAQPLEA
ncbi:MAG: glycosyltransferase family 9 protein [Bdellovibrionaceae bacterium]|jgi:heptosyltransferase III|nr:glycosyltransferase family 9 protein [Pseudobdellovibrionaceae bacterium]